jgi:hypothetical protein
MHIMKEEMNGLGPTPLIPSIATTEIYPNGLSYSSDRVYYSFHNISDYSCSLTLMDSMKTNPELSKTDNHVYRLSLGTWLLE